jgi:hypothetical protein
VRPEAGVQRAARVWVDREAIAVNAQRDFCISPPK